ncbi:MAG TPA: shikimate dehydrogenase [Rhizomicrobium sp.]|nr:shikimate dehydrogenase [Rhizomicrobium sp.]
MTLTGKTKLAGIVGWPVAHSLSPVLHGHWLREYGIDGAMVPLPTHVEDFAAVIDGVRRAGFRGVNVTVPHKEAAFALAHAAREAARVAGAANLLVFTPDGGTEADNTDAAGLFDSLERDLGTNSIRGRNIVILGAGGAARGAAFGLWRYGGAAKITILNRGKDRADQLAGHIAGHLPDAVFETGTLADWSKAARDAWLVVNTTSAGMKGNPALALDLSVLPNAAAVCDIVYNPLQTPLLQQAAARGLKTIDGLGMLMHQAVPSFEAFFGVRPEVTPELRAALVRALDARA